MDITTTPAWSALQSTPPPPHLRELFADDPKRDVRYRLQAGDLRIDYSKNLIDDDVMRRCSLSPRRRVSRRGGRRCSPGEPINVTERRAVLHTALRAPRDAVVDVDGHNVVPDVHEVLQRMAAFADRVRSGAWRGATGEPMQTVVNIGIGGSDLGPAMAYLATEAFGDRSLRCRFVSNVDGADITGNLADLDPATTLFIVSSKTFTTIETLTNARQARQLADRGARRGRRSASTSSPSAPTPRRSPRSASTPRTCSGSGTGSAGATRSTRRSACR